MCWQKNHPLERPSERAGGRGVKAAAERLVEISCTRGKAIFFRLMIMFNFVVHARAGSTEARKGLAGTREGGRERVDGGGGGGGGDR